MGLRRVSRGEGFDLIVYSCGVVAATTPRDKESKSGGGKYGRRIQSTNDSL
jgi:hypothetical protein